VKSFICGGAAFGLIALVTACSSDVGNHHNGGSPSASPRPLAAVAAALLPVDQANAAMGTTAMALTESFTSFRDDRALLPNLNCLGVFQPGEQAVYADGGSSSITGTILRQPNTDSWDAQVVQAGTVYPTAGAATAFLAASADRWSKCTKHTVNITVNDGPRTTFRFGDLDKTQSRLTMSFTRNATERSCQRALSVVDNVVVDVKACSHDASDAATKIAQQITERIQQ
jgi:hypothetical protein